MSTAENLHVAVVGGGLVGALCSCLLGNRGMNVDLYEMRDDIRTVQHVTGRSLNLALSVRGILALRAVGLEDVIQEHAIPMYGRMIHDLDWKCRPIPYGKKDQCIFSVGRPFLNSVLLTAAEKNPRVTVHFKHKLVSCDLDNSTMVFERPGGQEVKAAADLIVGCDGAFSAVRREILRRRRFNYNQKYITHCYIEFAMPPPAKGQFAMEENYLHIWPRGSLMLIALPNQDFDFIVNLFMPLEMFHAVDTPAKVIDFFETYFPDSIPLIGREKLVKDFFKNPPSQLISVKCSPYHIKDKVILLGDAAHAMPPFYGQGMNAGFEDCTIFDRLLDEFNCDLGKVLAEFSASRKEDAETVCDLSVYNYTEMSELVNTRKFLIRKRVDDYLHRMFPTTWIPLYTMVTFTEMPYTECVKNKDWQNKIISLVIRAACFVVMLVLITTIAKVLFKN